MPSHFTHRHYLDFVNRSSSFACNACGLEGSGDRYERDEFCDWYLHKTCKNCPARLTTHTHPDHQLTLKWAKGYTNEHEVKGLCGVCDMYITSRLYYSCETCSRSGTGFFLHPTCSIYPSRIDHPLDKVHYLTWQFAPGAWCDGCGQVCPDWHYRCALCDIDVHVECPVDTARSSSGLGTLAFSIAYYLLGGF
ncbi:hypothetical protein MKX03_001551 [Papaver bracteatum]|nr:hypothetical protein MKX03_001551 [Papaver bracteatum]